MADMANADSPDVLLQALAKGGLKGLQLSCIRTSRTTR